MKEVLNYLKDNVPTKQTAIQLFSLVILCFFVAGFVHETTHVALNDWRVDSVCVFNCAPMGIAGVFGNGYTPFGVHLSEPKNPIAEDETAPTFAGIGVSFLFGLGLMRTRGWV